MPRASLKRGDAVPRHADTLRFALFEARPAGLVFTSWYAPATCPRARCATGWPPCGTKPPNGAGPPLTWTRANGYQLGAERDVLEAYERTVIKEKLTEFRRLITGTVGPHAAARPGDKWVKHIVAQLNSIESTLDLIASS